MSQFQLPVILLMGPTAAGKTGLAVELVESFDMEIISVDSAMVYREMDIGTAKPGPEILARAPHHLIDIRDPADSYSAAEFSHDADGLIKRILSKGRIPLLCGGTMLYFRAITQGLSQLPQSDEKIRRAISEEAQQYGWHALHEKLAAVDPEAAARIHPNDPQRIQRALEVYRIAGISLTELTRKHRPKGLPYQFASLVVSPADRSILHERIATRFDQMIADGLVEEVRRLRERGDLDLQKPSMRSVGYRQIWQYLDGEQDLEQARLKGIYATRQLAKRQLTWLRSIKEARWFDLEKTTEIQRIKSVIKGEIPAKA
jgi:tRNA dimethylallyltransferase